MAWTERLNSLHSRDCRRANVGVPVHQTKSPPRFDSGPAVRLAFSQFSALLTFGEPHYRRKLIQAVANRNTNVRWVKAKGHLGHEGKAVGTTHG